MEQGKITDRYLTLEEASEYLGFSRRNFDRYLKRGEIKFSCPGREYRFKLEWLDEFMERHSASPKLGRVDEILERLNV